MSDYYRPTQTLCLDVQPGYQQFPGRCVLLEGHKGLHRATERSYRALLPKVEEWS